MGITAVEAKNFLTAALLSGGVPMLVMGDEVRRTQGGNNNPYCQDNEASWLHWNLRSKHADVLRFTKLLIARRLSRDVEHERRRLSLLQTLREQDYAWHGVKLNQPDWSPCSHSFAIGGTLKGEGVLVHIIFNACWEPLDFELPNENWRRWIDTSLDSPDDICEWDAEAPVPGRVYSVGPRSVVVLIAEPKL